MFLCFRDVWINLYHVIAISYENEELKVQCINDYLLSWKNVTSKEVERLTNALSILGMKIV